MGEPVQIMGMEHILNRVNRKKWHRYPECGKTPRHKQGFRSGALSSVPRSDEPTMLFSLPSERIEESVPGCTPQSLCTGAQTPETQDTQE